MGMNNIDYLTVKMEHPELVERYEKYRERELLNKLFGIHENNVSKSDIPNEFNKLLSKFTNITEKYD